VLGMMGRGGIGRAGVEGVPFDPERDRSRAS
jgi:hypothetical protein